MFLVYGLCFGSGAFPALIALALGFKEGSHEVLVALFIGCVLMGAWILFLILGGRGKINQFVDRQKQRTLERLGAS